jgi:hypothetical protein
MSTQPSSLEFSSRLYKVSPVFSTQVSDVRIHINPDRHYLLMAEECGFVKRNGIDCLAVAEKIEKELRGVKKYPSRSDDEGFRIYRKGVFVDLTKDIETDNVVIHKGGSGMYTEGTEQDQAANLDFLFEKSKEIAAKCNEEKNALTLCSPAFPDGVPYGLLPKSIIFALKGREDSFLSHHPHAHYKDGRVIANECDKIPTGRIVWRCDEWDSQEAEFDRLSMFPLIGMMLTKIRNTRPKEQFKVRELADKIKRFWDCQDPEREKKIQSLYRGTIELCIERRIIAFDWDTMTVTSIRPSLIPMIGNRVDVDTFLFKSKSQQLKSIAQYARHRKPIKRAKSA